MHDDEEDAGDVTTKKAKRKPLNRKSGAKKGAGKGIPKKGSTTDKLKKLVCWPEVDRRVKAGYPLPDIVRYIQEDREELDGVTPDSIKRALGRYRESLPPGEVVAQHMPETFLKKEQEFKDGLDELERMKDLCDLFWKRVQDIDRSMRDSMPGELVLPSKELAVEGDLLRRTLHQRAKLKIDLGMSGRDRSKLTLEAEIVEQARRKWGNEMASTISDPTSRNKVVSIMDKIRRAKKLEDREQHFRDIEDV